ncbi:MAG TPA: ribosome biogenesis GTPase Der [Chthonomonadaceae bacterium]|nr:ribosome biogenesis GTPase Der [Chthonomonadaceae bacterium]
MSRPLVAVVGRPNVGKSTLFNRLVGRRVAIVEDTPGITRDRLYHSVEWRGIEFTVIDTGGIILNETDPLAVQVRAQAEIAMEEAEVILFVVDAADGMTSTDQDIANVLRASKRPVLLVVNKTDNPRLLQDAAEFYALGLGEIYTVSAVHGQGVADLLDAVVSLFPADFTQRTEEDEDATRLAIIGRPNVGKSSLLNSILGEERTIVSPIPGTTRDSIDTNFEWDGQKLVLIDTAGIRRSGKIQGTVEYYMVLRAQTALERSNVGMVVIDASTGVLDGDKRVAGMAQEAGRACIIVVNKWDLVDPGVIYEKGKQRRPDRAKIEKFTEKFRKDCQFLEYAPLVFVSALERFGVRYAIETALTAAQNHAHRIPTGELNRMIRDATERRPLMEHGRQFKVYYATMPRVQPPTILLFCNDDNLLHFSYKRYLENQIRLSYPLEGTPIRIQAKKVENKEKDKD